MMIIAMLWTLTMSGQSIAVSDTIPVAANFAAMTADGRVVELRALPKDKLTLLVFYDPDCRDCRQMLFALRHASIVKETIEQGLLQVMAVDVDSNEALWREFIGELPATWMKTLLRSDLSQSRLYDTSAVPMLYLLDADHRVMLVDNDVLTLTKLLNSLW